MQFKLIKLFGHFAPERQYEIKLNKIQAGPLSGPKGNHSVADLMGSGYAHCRVIERKK